MAATQANSFRGKVAFVTGGSRGIGAGVVRRLALDGASVAFTYSNSEEKALHLVREIESSAGNALALKADSAYAEELQSTVIKATEFFGPLDIFVSNAGILRRAQSIPTASKTSIAWSRSTSVRPSSVFRQPREK
jgi:3-oxoacyl-[acyl-carrier protein] reductase